jgi:predicted AlkP superfamily pyrophosphatase or phosphodiesterase
MTVVVLGVDALDPQLLDSEEYPNLSLEATKSISTILSSETGRPSTHELWPSIITGLPPTEHGIQLEEGLQWENPFLNIGSRVSNYVIPKPIQVKIGSWLLDNTDEGNFRTPTTYYERNGLETVFDKAISKAIGVPNYVVDPDEEDREHTLRKSMGDLFQLDLEDETGHRHKTSDPREFYELCMEMSMVRVARVRRALRSRNYELVFGYTSGLDLVGHVAYAEPGLQRRAYEEMNDFVGELREDLEDHDELMLVSDHGLQEGEHTEEAAVTATSSELIHEIESILDVKEAIEGELRRADHSPEKRDSLKPIGSGDKGEEVREHLEDLGYM